MLDESDNFQLGRSALNCKVKEERHICFALLSENSPLQSYILNGKLRSQFYCISEATNMLIKVLCKAGAYPIEQKGYGLIVFGMNKKAVLTKIDALQLLIEIYDAGNHLTNQKIVSMETIECFFQELFHICPVLRKKAKHCKKLLQLKFTTMYTKQQDSHLNVLFVYKNKDFYLTFTPDFQMKMLFNQGSCLQYLHDEKEMIDFFLNF